MATCKQLLLLPSHGNALSSLEKSEKVTVEMMMN